MDNMTGESEYLKYEFQIKRKKLLTRRAKYHGVARG